jgi:hypothetical protein
MRTALIPVVLAAALVTADAGAAGAAWSDGFYKGYGAAGNVCIAFEVRGKKVTRLEVKGAAEECGHRYRCTGRMVRSAPGGRGRNVRIDRKGRFETGFDATRRAPRPGVPSRRMAVWIAGTLNGKKAKGTFRTLFDAGGDGRCDSGVLRWTARRVARSPWIGGKPAPKRVPAPGREPAPRREPPPPAEDPLEPLVP